MGAIPLWPLPPHPRAGPRPGPAAAPPPRRIAGMDLAPVTMAEDLTRILVAIETLDRALTAEGQPYMPPMSTD